jgi:predicted CopG family antitoxin
MTITISIQESTWKELINRKQPGESFDSVIRKALFEIPISKESARNQQGISQAKR